MAGATLYAHLDARLGLSRICRLLRHTQQTIYDKHTT